MPVGFTEAAPASPAEEGSEASTTNLKDAANEIDTQFQSLGDDFDDFTDDLVEVETQAQPASPSQVTEAQPQQPAAPTPAPEAGAPKPDGTTQPQVAQPAQPEPQPVQQAQQTPPEQPVGLDNVLQQMGARKSDLVQALALQQFAVTPEQAAELEEDYGKAIPKLLANVYVEAVQTAAALVFQHLPAIIDARQMQTQTSKSVEEQFFGQFKHLNKQTHGEAIKRVAQTLRAGNPHISQSDLFSLTGAMVSQLYKVNPAPAAANPQPQVAAIPYAPVGSAPTNGRSVQEQDLTPWSGLGGDYD